MVELLEYNDPNVPDLEGGWQHLYQIKEDPENGIQIEVVFTHHHSKEHGERRSNTADETLKAVKNHDLSKIEKGDPRREN